VFETKIEQKVKTENNDVNENEKDKKEKNKGTEGGKEEVVDEEGNRRNPDGTMRGVLVAVCPLYVKYNR
jgi:hypothetical protein